MSFVCLKQTTEAAATQHNTQHKQTSSNIISFQVSTLTVCSLSYCFTVNVSSRTERTPTTAHTEEREKMRKDTTMILIKKGRKKRRQETHLRSNNISLWCTHNTISTKLRTKRLRLL